MNKIPEIEFRYSWIYDEKYRSDPRVIKELNKSKMKYHSYKTIDNYILKLRSYWKKQGNKILKKLSEISGLCWKEDKIICYIVGYGIPFSDPLTIPVYKNDLGYGIYVLTHELIHQLFTQKGNLEKTDNYWKHIHNKYKKESFNTKIHIPLHAILFCLWGKFFGDREIKKDIKFMRNKKDYNRSHNIVNKEGYESIIKEFRRGMK